MECLRRNYAKQEAPFHLDLKEMLLCSHSGPPAHQSKPHRSGLRVRARHEVARLIEK